MLRHLRSSVFLALTVFACSTESNSPGSQTNPCQNGNQCGTVCTNLASDPANCGQCGITCGVGQVCSLGICSASCGANLSPCGSACADLTSDFTNCGSCGLVCTSGSCAASQCVSTSVGGGSGLGGNSGLGGISSGVGGMTAIGGSSSIGGNASGGGGTVNPGSWNAFVVSAAANAVSSEYTKWRSAFFKACNDGLTAGIWNGGNVVSEGVGYGMLITANAGTQADFDAVYAFYKKGSKSPKGLLNWTCSFTQASCSISCSGNGATDADLDIAAALLQAGKRWGGTYTAEATTVIKTLRGAVVENCGTVTDIRPGDVWGGCTDPGSGLINPSYYAPAYYRAFAVVDTEGAAVWNQLVEDTYPLWTLGFKGHPDMLFLWPDAQKWNGSAFVNDKGFAYNGYDACRVPWRIATDFAWSGDSRAKELLAKVSTEIDSASITTNTLKSVPYPNNSAFVGSLALSGVAISQDKANAYYNAWMSASLDDGPYFQGTLRMLYLLVAAGQFASPL